MSWLKRITPGIFSRGELYHAMLPDWFAEAVRANLTDAEIKQRIARFLWEAKADHEKKALEATNPPTEEYVEATYSLYRELLTKAQAD